MALRPFAMPARLWPRPLLAVLLAVLGPPPVHATTFSSVADLRLALAANRRGDPPHRCVAAAPWIHKKCRAREPPTQPRQRLRRRPHLERQGRWEADR